MGLPNRLQNGTNKTPVAEAGPLGSLVVPNRLRTQLQQAWPPLVKLTYKTDRLTQYLLALAMSASSTYVMCTLSQPEWPNAPLRLKGTSWLANHWKTEKTDTDGPTSDPG